ncbi:MAG: YfhO family protein [Elusimicrobiota bacterium]
MKIRDLVQKHPNLVFYTALCAVVALANLSIVSGRRYMNWDSYYYFYPKFLYFVDSLKSGYFPLWNSFELSGVPFIPWNGFLFNPINFIFVALAQIFNPLYVFQLMLLSLVVVGGAGTYNFLNSLNYPKNVSWFGSLAFSLTMYGMLLGQYNIAYAVAFAPWGLYGLNNILNRQGRISVNQIVVCALILCCFIITAYPVMIFLVALLLGSWGIYKFSVDTELRRGPAIFAVVKKILLICVLAGLCSSFVSIPLVENRVYVAHDLQGEFTAPDPWVRVFLKKTDPVCGYDANLLNYLKSFVSPVGWSEVSGVAVLFLGVLALTRFLGDPLLRSLFLLLAVFISYTHGRGGIIYEFVFDYVPIFGNNRYPLIGLLMFKAVLLVISAHYLAFWGMIRTNEQGRDWELRKVKILGLMSFFLMCAAFLYKPFLLIGISGIAFTMLSFQYLKGRISGNIFIGCLVLSLFTQAVPGRHRYVDEISYNTDATKSRVTSVIYKANFRDVTVSAEPWSVNSWVFNKIPINQGYYTADTVPYWYLKNHRSIQHFFYTTRNIAAEDAGIVRAKYKTDNEFVAASLAQVLSQKNGATIVDKMPDWEKEEGGGKWNKEESEQADLSNISIAPNELKVDVKTAHPVLLVLTDKYYPGWKVFVDGVEKQIVKTNLCFKGVYLEAGTHKVMFSFRPKSFYIAVFISCLTLLILAVWVVIVKLKDAKSAA